ncbi:hypothetical protein [Caulobacter hibisci]|uniref:XRE family transcriptional regulator n=1 Tax=Caulobacter hibisci TaxID=2035993 RepID=A0ABS0SY08_9CAUL|nr:hypothetical protein [Caulobacter hibisci]MBI1684429.1 hypothetical protein [Caulobacter hibisci]
MTELIKPLFDAVAFAQALRQRLADRADLPGYRDAAAEAGVSAATFSRAANADATLSHENFLRLSAWLAAASGGKAAA